MHAIKIKASTNYQIMKNIVITMLMCLSVSTAVFGQVQRESLNIKDDPMVNITVEYATNNRTYELRIFDINGHCVHQDIISSPKQNINADHLSSGQYFLQIGKGQAAITLMIVK